MTTTTRRSGHLTVFCAALLAVTVHVALPLAQQTPTATKPPAAVGLYNWIHSTANSEQSFPFYRDVLGITLTRSPFAGPAPANAPPEQIRPVSDAAPDPLIWDLTDTKGSRFRNVFTRAPNTPFGLELSEFLDIPREARSANPWDPGASSLIFQVRDLNSVVAKATAVGARFVTLGSAPIDTPAGRSVIVRDPDGYLIQLTQASPSAIATAKTADQIVGTSIGISVADTTRALAFYRGLLGFEVRESRRATPAELRVNGLAGGQLTQTRTVIAGTDITVVFSEFTLAANAAQPAIPFRWRIQDVGAPQFQLQVRNLDALIEQTKTAGYRFLSVGAKPIQRPFGRFVFAIDPDGVLVEYVEPSQPGVSAQAAAAPTDRFVTVDGQRIHVVDWGNPNRQPLVLIHGLDRVARTFDPVAMHFSSAYHVVAYDMRGHGDSAWDPQGRYLVEDHVGDLAGVVAELGLRNIVVWGNSTGGRVAQVFAGMRPDLVARLVAEDVGPERPRQIADAYARRVQQEAAGWASETELAAAVRKANPGMSQAVLDAYVLHGSRRTADGRVTWKRDPNLVKGFVETDLWRFVRNITAPSLYLLGGRSTIVAATTQDELRRALPQAQIITMPGLGHYPSDEKPTEAMAIVEAFLKGAPAQGGAAR